MHQDTLSTREKILQTACSLFARKGYDAVSIRDICHEVGIKESTVYYHYANKRDILVCMLKRIDALIDWKREAFDAAFQSAAHVSEDEMAAVAVHLLTDYYCHPDVHRILSILSIERLHDEALNSQYLRIACALPLAQQEAVFQRMAARGMIRGGDTRGIAILFHGVVYSAYAQHCLGASEPKIECAMAMISDGIRSLYRSIITEQEADT